jgi:hypothetical protein
MTRIAAGLAALLLAALPGSALAAHRAHRVRTSVSVPKPTVVVPHIYDAGGDGGELTTPPTVHVTLFDPTAIARALGNDVLGQLGLPPV